MTQFNGNIAETSWRTASDNIQRRYGYTYDKLNRLTDVWYQIPQSMAPVRNSYDEHVTYDVNGNIITLQRNGELDSATTVTEIDNLSYSYDGNRLLKVKDDPYSNTAGFRDVDIQGVADYTYDAYGNMLTDQNKYITGITYNHLNLPTQITISGNTDATKNGSITYLYNAAGVKFKKTVTPAGGTPVATIYMDGYQYVDGILEFFPTSEGYIKNKVVSSVNNYNYVFQYKDHLGNNRISYTKDPADNILKILEEDHYYPFGLKHEGYSANQEMITTICPPGKICAIPAPVTIVPVINPADVKYKYMYNGKELQDELGLAMYDFGARNYDPAIGRWMNIDPLAENSRRWTPYNYCYNNPVFFIDPDGMQVDGEFVNEKGKVIGNDGKSDNKRYVIKTTETSYGSTSTNSKVKAAGLDKQVKKDAIKFVERNSSAFEANPSIYESFQEFEGDESIRQDMVDSVSKDSGNGGTKPENNQEHGGVTLENGTFENRPSGDVTDLSTAKRATFKPGSMKGVKSVTHDHPSGTLTLPNGDVREYNQPPSPADVRQAGNRVDSSGVQATLPLKYFVTPKK